MKKIKHLYTSVSSCIEDDYGDISYQLQTCEYHAGCPRRIESWEGKGERKTYFYELDENQIQNL